MWKDLKASGDAADIKRLVIEAFGYTDLAGKLRASYLMGMATEKLWAEVVRDVHKECDKEIHAACQGLSKWGAPVSDESVKDIVAKVMMAHNFYPYPEVVTALSSKIHNPDPLFKRHLSPSYIGDQEKLVDEASIKPPA